MGNYRRSIICHARVDLRCSAGSTFNGQGPLLGRDWLTKHDFSGFGLDEVRLLSYPDVQIAAMSHSTAKRRFYYWIIYRSEAFDGGFMYVYVLMWTYGKRADIDPLPAKKS